MSLARIISSLESSENIDGDRKQGGAEVKTPEQSVAISKVHDDIAMEISLKLEEAKKSMLECNMLLQEIGSKSEKGQELTRRLEECAKRLAKFDNDLPTLEKIYTKLVSTQGKVPNLTEALQKLSPAKDEDKDLDGAYRLMCGS